MCTLIKTPRYIDKETIRAFKVFLFAPKSRNRFEGLYRNPNGEASNRFSCDEHGNYKRVYYRAGKVYRSGLPGFQAFLELESARAWAQTHDGEVIVPVLMRLVIGTGSNPHCDNTRYGGDNGIVVGLEMEISEAELIQP